MENLLERLEHLLLLLYSEEREWAIQYLKDIIEDLE